jgi:phenylacetyl-CoA:acceptor oxidoreductase subunit 2
VGQVRSRGVEPLHQKHWDWKAAGNFMCGGAGSGLLAVAAAAALLGAPARAPMLAGAGLVALGLFLVLLKIGRPWRALNVLRQPQRSWMAREAWVAMPFFPLAALGLWRPEGPLALAAGVVALAFLLCQAMILFGAKGIPTWREPRVVSLIMLTGLTEGGGLFLALLSFANLPREMVQSTAIVVVLLAAARHWAWRVYVRSLATTGAPRRTLDTLQAAQTWMIVLGLALPTLCVVAGIGPGLDPQLVFALGGLCALAAGWLLKVVLVRRAGYNQGFALEHIPARGTGAVARAVKPGWSRAATITDPNKMEVVR